MVSYLVDTEARRGEECHGTGARVCRGGVGETHILYIHGTGPGCMARSANQDNPRIVPTVVVLYGDIAYMPYVCMVLRWNLEEKQDLRIRIA